MKEMEISSRQLGPQVNLLPFSFFQCRSFRFSLVYISICELYFEWVCMDCEYFQKELHKIDNSEDFHKFIDIIRPICANEKTERIKNLLERALEKSTEFTDKRILIKLYDLKIRQLYSTKNELSRLAILHSEMHDLCLKLKYEEGLALTFQLGWHIEKLKNNIKESSNNIKRSIDIVENSTKIDDYTYYFCNYSFALDRWLNQRDFSSVEILEGCVNYFYQNGFIHGLTMGLGILVLILQYTQNKEKTLNLIQKFLYKEELITRMPEEIKSIIYYFIGVGSKLNFDLKRAEYYLLETQNILKSVYKRSIYSGYYLRALSHLTSCFALQGKLELAYNQMIEVEELIEEGIAARNLDTFGKKQIEHDFNLTKFYIHSRLQTFQIDELQDLVQNILDNLNKQHSDAIFLSEFLLNANLSREQLLEIKNLQNPSTKRVEHIINFLIEKSTSPEEKQIINLISILKKRPVEERMTLVERAFADLLAAQEYYKIERYAEIYPLLRKYENQLHRIEILELRLFMEAFIQIGAFKNGDPMGPALQYVAIRKCQHYGFSRLENRLLNYLDLQAKDVFQR